MKIIFFNPRVVKFVESLDKKTHKKVTEAFELLEIHEYLLTMPYSKPIGGKIFELRIINNLNIRFLYTFYNNSIWILHGFIKKTNRISNHDIDYARKELFRLLHEYNV